MAADEQIPQRATVASVESKVELLLEKFKNLDYRLDAVSGLPVAVATIQAQIVAINDRLASLESSKARFPMLLLTAIGVTFTGLGILIAYVVVGHHG